MPKKVKERMASRITSTIELVDGKCIEDTGNRTKELGENNLRRRWARATADAEHYAAAFAVCFPGKKLDA